MRNDELLQPFEPRQKWEIPAVLVVVVGVPAGEKGVGLTGAHPPVVKQDGRDDEPDEKRESHEDVGHRERRKRWAPEHRPPRGEEQENGGREQHSGRDPHQGLEVARPGVLGNGPNGHFEPRLGTQVEGGDQRGDGGRGGQCAPTGSVPRLANVPPPPDDDDVQDTVRGGRGVANRPSSDRPTVTTISPAAVLRTSSPFDAAGWRMVASKTAGPA